MINSCQSVIVLKQAVRVTKGFIFKKIKSEESMLDMTTPVFLASVFHSSSGHAVLFTYCVENICNVLPLFKRFLLAGEFL